MKRLFPRLIVLFVPAGCTGLVQVLDLVFNAPFKSILSRKAALWFAERVKEQLEEGVPPERIDIKTGKREMCGPFTEWVAEAVQCMASEKKALIASGWKTPANKVDLTLAWNYGDQRRQELLREATLLHEKGELFAPAKNRNGEVNVNSIPCAGAAVEELPRWPDGKMPTTEVMPEVNDLQVTTSLMDFAADIDHSSDSIAVPSTDVDAPPEMDMGNFSDEVLAAVGSNGTFSSESYDVEAIVDAKVHSGRLSIIVIYCVLFIAGLVCNRFIITLH